MNIGKQFISHSLKNQFFQFKQIYSKELFSKSLKMKYISGFYKIVIFEEKSQKFHR